MLLLVLRLDGARRDAPAVPDTDGSQVPVVNGTPHRGPGAREQICDLGDAEELLGLGFCHLALLSSHFGETVADTLK
jgi:hypothetical protein